MLQVIAEQLIEIRKKQVISLYKQICIENPIRLNLEKIKHPVYSINLAWLIAIVSKGWNSFGDINFKDDALCAMAEVMMDKLYDELEKSGELTNCGIPKYGNESHFINLKITERFSYLLPPALVISLLKKDHILNQSALNTNDQIKEKIGISSNVSISQANIYYTNVTNHIDNSNTNLYQIEANLTNNFHQKDVNRRDSDLEKSSTKCEKDDEEKNVKTNKNGIIKKMLEEPLINIIKDINPSYEGAIYNKTSPPHKLLIRVMAMMVKLEIPKVEITWSSIHQFIDHHIYQHQPFSVIANLDDLNEDMLIVKGHTLLKRNCQNNISSYKKKIFGLT